MIRYPRSILAICIAAVLTGAFLAGIAQDQHQRRGVYDPEAYAAAISHRLFGDEWGKTYRAGVMAAFHDRGLSTETLKDIAENGVSDMRKVPLIGGNDRGYHDFVLLSVVLFGVTLQGTYYLFYLILAVSCSAYVWSFRHSVPRLAELQVLLMGMAIYTYALTATNQLANLADSRVIGVLSLPALLHWLRVLSHPPCGDRFVRSPELALLVLQGVILLAAVLCRTAAIWQLAVIAVVGLYFALTRLRAGLLRPALFSGLMAVVLIGALLAARTAQHAGVAAAQRGEAGTHLFWHNVGIGFSLHPRFAEIYGTDDLILSDPYMFNIVLKKTLADGTVDRIFEKDSTGTYIIPDWRGDRRAAYERAAKQVVFGFVRDHPLETLRLLVFDKPLGLIQVALMYAAPPVVFLLEDIQAGLGVRLFDPPDAWAQRHIAGLGERLQAGSLFSPLRVVFLLPLVVLIFVLRSADVRGFVLGSAGLFAVMMVGSLMPIIGVYPVAHTAGPFMVLLGGLAVPVLLAVVMPLFAKFAFGKEQPLDGVAATLCLFVVVFTALQAFLGSGPIMLF